MSGKLRFFFGVFVGFALASLFFFFFFRPARAESRTFPQAVGAVVYQVDGEAYRAQYVNRDANSYRDACYEDVAGYIHDGEEPTENAAYGYHDTAYGEMTRYDVHYAARYGNDDYVCSTAGSVYAADAYVKAV